MNSHRFGGSRLWMPLIAGTVALLAVAACGSNSSGGAAPAGSTAPTTAGSSSAAPGLAQAQAAVAKYESNAGTFHLPQFSKPLTPPTGKHITIISCGQTSSSCARATEGAISASKALGWSYTVFDTKGDYSTAATGIRQAIAAKSDGIFIYFIDCSYMKQPLEEAKAAGIPVVQAEGADCNITDSSAPSLFTWSVTYSNGPLLTWVKSFSAAQTSYAIAAAQGKANVIMFADNAAVLTKVQLAAFKQQMVTCSECTYKIVTMSFTQMANGVSQLAADALNADPKANTVIVAYDAILQAGVSQAVQQAERTGRSHLTLIAGEGQTPTMALVRQGVVASGSGLDNEWEAWSAIDALVRIMNNQKPVTSGIGNQIYDKTHNLPASGPYKAPLNFEAAYEKGWGLG
jgi:ribose transport system substrate-binding protein